jgi:hypothetical protein
MRLNAYVAVLNTDNILFQGPQAFMEEGNVSAGETICWPEDLESRPQFDVRSSGRQGWGPEEEVQGRNRDLAGQVCACVNSHGFWCVSRQFLLPAGIEQWFYSAL